MAAAQSWARHFGACIGCGHGAGAVDGCEAEEALCAAARAGASRGLVAAGVGASASPSAPAREAAAPEARRGRSKDGSDLEGSVVSVSTNAGADVEEASVGSRSCSSSSRAPTRASWWQLADVGSIPGFEGVEEVSRLLEARVERGRRGLVQHGQCEEVYRAMGVRDPTRAYVVCWLHFGDVSLVFASEATDLARLEASIAEDALMKRIKFILNPVRIGVPCPAKGLKDAETVGSYFGPRGSSLSRSRTADGAQLAVLQIDMHSKLLLRMMLSKIAFREGNCVEMLIADWTGRAVLSSVRFEVTKELLQLLR